MSSAVAVSVIAVVLAITGVGVLAVLGVARTPGDLVRHAAIAPLAGMAWAGVVGATVATVGLRFGLVALCALAVATCVAGAARIASARPSSRDDDAPARTRPGALTIAVASASVLAIGVITFAAILVFRIKPLAEYDGWAMWGMKARALATHGGTADVFASDAYARLHLEYPLLLPALHALPLELVDGAPSNPVVLSCLAVGLAGLLAMWGVLRGRVRAAILLPFVAAAATTPAFFGQLVTGYADIPLAAFVAPGVACLGRWLVDDERAWLALGTLLVAAAALTKNEGLLFAAAAYCALLTAAAGRRRTVAAAAGVVALVYAPWRAYVAINDLGAPDYDLSSSFNLPWVARRLDRAPEAAQGLFDQATDENQFAFLVALGIAALAVAFLAGARSVALFGTGFAVLSFAGLTWIYVLTPNEVSSYLSSNGNRVIVSLVFGLAAVAPLVLEQARQELSAERAQVAPGRSEAGRADQREEQPVRG